MTDDFLAALSFQLRYIQPAAKSTGIHCTLPFSNELSIRLEKHRRNLNFLWCWSKQICKWDDHFSNLSPISDQASVSTLFYFACWEDGFLNFGYHCQLPLRETNHYIPQVFDVQHLERANSGGYWIMVRVIFPVRIVLARVQHTTHLTILSRNPSICNCTHRAHHEYAILSCDILHSSISALYRPL